MAFDAVKNFVTGTTKAIGNAARSVANTAGNMVQTYAQVQPATYAWTGKSVDQMNTLEKTAFLRSMGNKDAARNAFAALAQETQTVGSRHYSPYSTGKSNQKEAMAFFGLDSFDQNWLDENRFLLNYTNQLDLTDTISTSGQKNWSDAQWAGYYYSQLSEAEKTTQAAENEWAQLRGDMQRNFNEYKRLYGEAPSYDKLMSYIDMNDYSTLQKMDKVYSNVEDLVRLNRSIEYTPETMVGVYASLLNGKDVTQDGDYFEEAVQYTMKPVQQPKQQPERANYSGWTQDQIDAKRNEIRKTGTRADLAQFEADLYVSTPHLDSVDSESYFKDTYYDQAFLDKYAYLGEYAEQLRNRDGKIEKPAASDPWWYGAAYEYDQIRSREEDTRKAEEEWKALRKSLTASYAEGDDVDILLEDMNWDKYPTLKKLREGKDVDLNRPVYFSDEAIKGVLQAHANGQDTNNDDFDYAFYQAPVRAQEEPEKIAGDQESEEKQPIEASTYFTGPSAYDGKIEGIDYDESSGEKEPDIQEPPTGMNPEDFEKEEPYQFDPNAYFSGPAQTPEAIAADEQQKAEAEQRKEERQSFIDNLWQRMTANTTIDATMIEKQFYEENGRPMTNAERIRSGLEPLHLPDDPVANELERLGIDVEYYEPGASIFDDTYNSIAQRYDYENMDQLIANDPALLSNMIDYVEAKPVNEEFSTTEVEHLKLLKQYQDDLEDGTLDEMFRAYADANGTDEAKLNGAINYIIESGLTLEEKGALGLLDNVEHTQLVAERADKVFGQHGGEMARAMAISLLGTDADEGALKVMEAAISHLFAVETGVAGGVLGSQMIGYNAARDLWSAIAAPMYEARLGEGYTLDQACEIDPLLRGLTAAVDKGNAITRIASPDMSSFNYGAEFTQFITKSAIDQKMAAFYAPVGQNFASSMFKKLGLGDLPEMLAADKKFSKAFELIGKTSNSMPWMLRSMSQSAQEARDMGAGERDAIKFGLFNAGTTGLIEGFIGQAYDGLLDKGSNVLAKGLSRLTKGGMDKFLAKNGVIKTMNVLQQAFSESLEEMAEAPLDKMGRMNILNQTAEEAGGDVKETWDNMKLSFVSSLFTSAFFGLSADQNTKLYTDSEKVLERIMNGEASVDEMMEYAMQETEAASGSSNLPALIPGMAEEGYVSPEVRDSVRIMHENQVALDNAAIDMAAEEIVQQQINEGAMDDLIGPASSNAKTLAAQEMEVQNLQQEAEQHDQRIQEIDTQKETALYAIISNGLSPEKGAARQTVHNFDEAKAAEQRRQEETLRKLNDRQTALQLEQDHIQAQVEQRKKEMKTAVVAQKRAEFEEARKQSDQKLQDFAAELSKRSKTPDQVVWGEGDVYAPFSAQNKSEGIQDEGSIWDAYIEDESYNMGLSESGDPLSDDNFHEVTEEEYNTYTGLLKYLKSNGIQVSSEHLKKHYDARTENDPIRTMTDGEYTTIGKSKDGRHVLIVNSKAWGDYNQLMTDYTDERDQIQAGYRDLSNEKDEKKRTEIRQKLDSMKAAQKKPDSPKGTYILLDMSRVSSDDAENPIRDQVEIIRHRIDARIAELQTHADDGTNKRQIEELTKLKGIVGGSDYRRIMDRLQYFAQEGNEKNFKTQVVRKLLDELPEVSDLERSEKDSARRMRQLTVGSYSNKNQAIDGLNEFTEGEFERYGSDPIYYATADLMDALRDLDAHYTQNGSIDVDSLGEAHPGLFFSEAEETSDWDQDAADARFNARYESKLASNNDKYVAIDQADGFNLVVAKRDTRLDARETGNIRVNPDIYSVSDAKRALQTALDGIAEQTTRQKALHDQEHLSANQLKYYQAMVICTVKDADGNDVNMSVFDFKNAFGGRTYPSAEMLFEMCERITVNYNDYDFFYPTKENHVKDRKTGEIEVREKLNPYREGGQDQYRFTLEKTSMAPDARVQDVVNTGADAYQSPTRRNAQLQAMSDFKRAEEDYMRYIGKDSFPKAKLLYFARLCDSYQEAYMREAARLSNLLESGRVVDAELDSIRQQMESNREAMNAWQYISNQVAAAIDAQNPEAMKSVMKKCDALLKQNGNASLDAKLAMTAAMRRSMETVRRNQLMASMPAGTTLESLTARHQELQSMLEEVMNARNQAAVLNHRSPAHLNNEPLAEAIMKEQDTVRNQLMIIESEPDFFSSLRQQHPAPQEQAPDTVDDTVEAPAAEAAENATEKPTVKLSRNAENEQVEEPEAADTVQKKQKMDRTYLGAIIDADTGEQVSSPEEVTGSEYVEADTGEVKQKEYPEVSAEDMSYSTPVEEFMERAGLSRTYSETAITDSAMHENMENQVDAAYQAVKKLTDRVDEIQIYLQSGAADESQTAAIQSEKQRYIDERNRIKAIAKRMDAQLASSDYYSNATIRNIANHCLESGEVDWESPEIRARDINEIYENDLSRMRKALQSKLVAGSTTALTTKDVADIIGSDELDKQLRMRHDVGFELSKRLHELDEALLVHQEQREEVLKQIDATGSTLELEAALGRIDEDINATKSKIENGQKTMRMYFDSGSEMSLEDILSGKDGGRIPLNVMNHIYAILKDIDANSKGTNRKGGADHFNNPLRVMEHYTGEWAPLLNAIYISPVQASNARMNDQMGKVVDRLQNSGLKHSESEDAMLYAEGKLTEEQFAEAYPNPADRDRIKKALVQYRTVYDSLFKDVNQALIRNGFDPIPYRANYIHHMNDAESGIAKACAMLGIHVTDDDLPTALAGRTDETKPRRGFMSASMERHGDETSYDIERNTMAYVNAAMRVIHHTDNISRLRQFEGIMDQTQNKRAVNSGLAQYSEVVDTNDLKRPGRRSNTAFSSMREWITEYTNLLAGKQSFIDRPAEGLIRRQGLQILNGLKNLTGSSIVVGNLNIATSNILPVMTMAGISPVQTASALADVVRAGADGMAAFEAQSDFLTARYAGQKFTYNWADVAAEKTMIPFEAIDRFAANAVVRTYQKIGLKNGWTPDVAMKWADQMAWRMMASTNTGEGANVMSSKTAGIFLQFSREGINNLQFLMHDLRNISDGAGDWLKKLLGIMIGGWLYNTAFNKTTAPELITPTLQSIREWDSEKSLMDNLGNAAGNYAEMLNPTNIGTGGDLRNVPLISNATDIIEAGYNAVSSAVDGDGSGVRDGLTDFFSAALGFIPGGLSIERLFNGLGDYYRGYTTDAKGNIKFTIDNDVFSAGSIHDAIFTLLLSPSGTKEGRKYTRNGNHAMTKTQTAAFHSEKATGMSNQEAYNSVMGHAEQKGNNNASDMVLPDWAAAEADSDWMQAVREFGVGAYPREVPEEMTINGVERKLTDEEKEAFVKRYKQTYRMYIVDAMTDGSNLHNAAESAYNTAYSNFRKGLED